MNGAVFGRELNRVSNKICNNLRYALIVSYYCFGYGLINVYRELLALFIDAEINNIGHALEHFLKIIFRRRKLKFVGFDFRHVQNVVDYAKQVIRRVLYF